MRPLTRRAGLVAWFVFLAVILTWPLAIHPRSSVLGAELSGVWRTLWMQVLTWKAFAAGGPWPVFAPGVSWPLGASVVTDAPLHDLFTAVVQLGIGPTAAYNLSMFGQLVAGALGGVALGRRLGLSMGASLLAGTIFGFNSLVLTAGLASGDPGPLGMCWLPWFLVAALRLIQRPAMDTAAVTGVALLLMGLGDPHQLVFSMVLAPLVLVPAAWDRWRGAERGPGRRAMIWSPVPLLIALGVGALILGPILAAASDPVAQILPGALRAHRLPDPATMGTNGQAFASLTGLLSPGRSSLVVHEDGVLTTSSVYLGWFAIVLASLGVRVGRVRWLVYACVGGLLAMGPYLLVSPASWRSVPTTWWVLLTAGVPGFDMVTAYVRASAAVFLGVAMLAAAAMDDLLARPERERLRLPLGVATSLLVLLEIASVGPMTLPVPTTIVSVPQSTFVLAQLQEPGGVIDWPQRYPGQKLVVPRYLFYQTIHGRPLAWSALGGGDDNGVAGNPLIAGLEKVTYGPDYRSASWDEASKLSVALGVDTLQLMGFRYLVVHPWQVAPERAQALATWLDGKLRLLQALPDGGRLYALELNAS